MDKIRFIKNTSNTYSVNLTRLNSNVVKLIFEDVKVPKTVGGFELINEHNDKVMGNYKDYTTVYRTYDDNNNVVELSNDGSVYVEPEPAPEPEVYEPTLDEVKWGKINELSRICEEVICSGIDLKIGEEIKHFSYKKTEDQSNIKELFDMAVSTNMPVYYHCDGGECMLYSVEEMVAIYAGNALNKIGNETYFNQMKSHIENDLDDKESVMSVYYGTPLPEERQSVLDDSKSHAMILLQTQLKDKNINFENVLAMINFDRETGLN